jgi:hypothetical protein
MLPGAVVSVTVSMGGGVFEAGDPEALPGYGYTDANPITQADPSGKMIPSDPGSGGNGWEPLSEIKVGKSTVGYADENGVPHKLGTTPDNEATSASLKYLNDDLRAQGLAYEASSGSGSTYFLQDDSNPLVPKDYITGVDGSMTVTGTTSDLIKVTWAEGKIVSVGSYDATASTQMDIGNIASTVNNKLSSPKGAQTQNVVFRATSQAQAEAVAAKFSGNPNVRVIFPEGNFDSMRVPRLTGGLEGLGGRFAGGLGAVGDLVIPIEVGVHLYQGNSGPWMMNLGCSIDPSLDMCKPPVMD